MQREKNSSAQDLWDSCDYVDDDLDPTNGQSTTRCNRVRYFKVNEFDFLHRKGSVKNGMGLGQSKRDSLEKVKTQTIAQMKCKSMRGSIPEVSLGSVKKRPNRGDSQDLLGLKNKSKFRLFKEKAKLKISLSGSNSDPSKDQVVNKIPLENFEEEKFIGKGELTPIMEKEHMESEKEQEDTYEKYLEEINNVGDLPHEIHVSEECGLQPGICKSSVPNMYNDNSECALQVFTARPNLKRSRVFNFLPQDIIKRIQLEKLEESSKSLESNPFLAAQSLLVDSGATPIFKEPTPFFNQKNEAYWLASNADVDFDHADRYLYEFFNHKTPEHFDLGSKDLQNFKKQLGKPLPDSGRTAQPRKVCIGEHDPTKKMAFIEIDKTIMLMSEEEIEDMPHYSYVDREFASRLGRKPFYIYLRPFVFAFLKAIMREYELVVYSNLDKKLLIFLLDILQSENEYFTISISHCVPGKPKNLSRFFTEGRSKKNIVLIDSCPEVVRSNMGSCVPIHPFKGKRLDVFLVYLRKYMLDLSTMEDMSEKITKDFSIVT
ncbi:unnamed protein product [Moneuplotes crassus]|uniref:Mitochondrial import inner membrane translocase subunit TIM50 n=1 Tax=Euplotes crassus TaxID=5936 RepID=A0AAD1XR69_EUPCR|nr:unnamed protein product [Moneuplotes crassus]